MVRHIAAIMLLTAIGATSGSASGQPTGPTRTPLATIPLARAKMVDRLEIMRVDFPPGHIMLAHKHTVPVVCFVTRGEFLVSIGDEPERRAALGAVTYEPAETVVHAFKNASDTAPAQLECASLASVNDHTLIVMLPQP